MGAEIKNISVFKHPVSFLQIHTLKGFKYIDKAGEIVNAYYHGDKEPPYRMGLDGLIIQNPTTNIEELKVTPQFVWAKFIDTHSLDMIIEKFNDNVSNIFKILDIEKIKRIGWRNHFVHEFEKMDDLMNYFNRIISLDPNKFSIASINTKIDTGQEFEGILYINAVIKNDKSKKPGVLLDIDLFQKNNISIDNYNDILKSFKSYLCSKDGFLNIVNSTFGQVHVARAHKKN